MKRIIKITAMLIGVAVIFGCRKEPEIPEPATPKGLSYQIQDGSILFSWFPAEDALSYGMEITTDAELSDLIFAREGIEDTFQLVSCDSFVADSTYYWRVRAEGEAGWGDWSDVASFTYATGGGLDLDTTYFPFGRGYEWCYEHYWFNSCNDPPHEGWDTVTYIIVDSFWSGDTLFFKSQYGSFRPIVNWRKEVFAGSLVHTSTWISLANPEPYYEEFGYEGVFRIFYEDSVLVFYWTENVGDARNEYVWDREDRLKGVGKVSSYHSYSNGCSANYTYRLLYFYNGQDTVYKAD